MADIRQVTIPLGDKPYATPFYSIGREECQNLYLESSGSSNAKAQYYYLKIPGMRKFGTTDETNLGACRALFTTSSGRSFGVFGSGFYEIDSNGDKGFIANLKPGEGQVSIAENGNQMMLVDGKAGYIYDYSTATFNIITDEYFPGNSEDTIAPTHVVFNDTRFLVNVPNSNSYYWSTEYYMYALDNSSYPYDPSVANGYWNPIQSGKKFAQADNIVGLAACQNYIWLFGYNSCEVHYDTGNYNGQLYARYDGAIIQIGCLSNKSIANWANNVFWFGSDKTGALGIYTNNGMQPAKISTRGIEQMIENMTVYDDAIGWVYSLSGHNFYVLYFPTASKTFVYDITMGSWHERTYLNYDTGLLEAHKALYSTSNFNKLIVGHISHSTIFQFDPKYYQNDNAHDEGVNYIKCVKTTPLGFSNGVMVRYNAIQPILQQGAGLYDNNAQLVGKNPLVWVRWSDDGGQSYTNERSAPIGTRGMYQTRSRILGCGMSRNRVWKIVVTDPIEVMLVGLITEPFATKF